MNTNQLISKAIHCLNTGQPNMATLYMNKAQRQITRRRQELKDETRALRYTQAANTVGRLGSAGARATDAMVNLVAAFSGIVPAQGDRDQMRTSYAAAAPSA